MNSSAASPTPVVPQSKPTALILVVKGLGHVPSFKNGKMLARGRLITDPKKQKWMEACIESFASQLRFLSQTKEDATSMDRLRLFLTASLPQDDCWQNVPELYLKVLLDEKGQEGAVVTIDPL